MKKNHDLLTFIISVFVLVFGINLVFYAQESNAYKFNQIDVEKGLSNSEVRCIFKDWSGFIWFGTPSGLNRYDGYEIITVKQDLNVPENLSSNNDIWRIQQDANGLLWLTTRAGYTIYDPQQEAFVQSPSEIFKQYAGTDDFWSVYNEGKNLWVCHLGRYSLLRYESPDFESFKTR
jgi:ligand-binding sensor domain-containing protein